jgi:hypothetical protein
MNSSIWVIGSIKQYPIMKGIRAAKRQPEAATRSGNQKRQPETAKSKKTQGESVNW